MIPAENNQQLLSLRSRYIWSSAIIALVLISAASFASWYAQHVTIKNTEALKFRDVITATTNKIRNRIWLSDIALNASLISPTSAYSEQISQNLLQAERLVQELANHAYISDIRFHDNILALQLRFEELSAVITDLLKKREDPNWVYPALPYINNKLLTPNVEFETAADQALHEIAEQDGRSYASEMFGRFDEVRDLWRRKILDFRAVVIRFAGLNEAVRTPQELNIDSLHELIEQKLDELDKLREQHKLGLESELALDRMREASKSWYKNWQEVKVYRNSSVWRADLQFMETTVRPAQKRMFDAINTIERSIMEWSASNVATVQAAATQISVALWGLSAIALIFVIFLYKLLDRSVLTPIAQITGTISSDGDIHHSQFTKSGSREINQLVMAFNGLQHQIRQRQIALEHQALHDSLTGLPNRALLQDRLTQAIHIMHRSHDNMALLLLDLDRFKEVNDALGHQVGDELLQHVSQRLESILRESDTVARLGGDEFAIVAPSTKPIDAASFAEKIVKSITEVFQISGQNLYVGVSVGIAIYPANGSDASTLIRHADIAMYHAKRNNLGYYIYKRENDEANIDRLALVGNLHDELNNPQHLQLYYQPQIHLLSQSVVTLEVLLRWHHPQMAAIPPEQIISLAEHTGLIGPLTNWIIETAVSECALCTGGHDSYDLSINLSAWNLQDPELPDTIRRILQHYQFPAERLTLEITESAMMNDPARARTILHELHEMAIKLAIDDFGTGFSSLGYLKLLPVDSLKIDKSFVIEMLDNENDAIIVQSTIDLAHNLGLTVIAEGVENKETMQRLRKLKCDIAQGYHITKPLPQVELLEWLQRYNLKLAK